MHSAKILLPLVLAASVPALAEDASLPENVWSGKGQAGYVASQGNTAAKSANAALDAALLDGAWKHAFHLGGLYGQNSGIVSAERWDTGWQSDYNLSHETFLFGAARYSHDLFSGFDYQASLTGGLGYKLVDTTATKFEVQVGAGYLRLRPEKLDRNSAGEVTARTLQPTVGSAVLTFGASLSHQLTETTVLTDKLLVDTGSTDTLVTNALALAVKINGKLSLSLGYNIQDNSKPPSGLKKLDTLETVNLVYSF